MAKLRQLFRASASPSSLRNASLFFAAIQVVLFALTGKSIHGITICGWLLIYFHCREIEAATGSRATLLYLIGLGGVAIVLYTTYLELVS